MLELQAVPTVPFDPALPAWPQLTPHHMIPDRDMFCDKKKVGGPCVALSVNFAATLKWFIVIIMYWAPANKCDGTCKHRKSSPGRQRGFTGFGAMQALLGHKSVSSGAWRRIITLDVLITESSCRAHSAVPFTGDLHACYYLLSPKLYPGPRALQ